MSKTANVSSKKGKGGDKTHDTPKQAGVALVYKEGLIGRGHVYIFAVDDCKNMQKYSVFNATGEEKQYTFDTLHVHLGSDLSGKYVKCSDNVGILKQVLQLAKDEHYKVDGSIVAANLNNATALLKKAASSKDAHNFTFSDQTKDGESAVKKKREKKSSKNDDDDEKHTKKPQKKTSKKSDDNADESNDEVGNTSDDEAEKAASDHECSVKADSDSENEPEPPKKQVATKTKSKK